MLWCFQPTTPAAEAIFTMEPPPVFSIETTPYFIQRNTPLQVHRMDAVPALRGLFVQRRHFAAEPGIVDEDVEAAEFLFGGGNHAANAASSATSACTAKAAAPMAAATSFCLTADIGADDLGAFGGEQFRHGLAHARNPRR